ncbi:MAG: hypothetical protein O3C28_02645 [Proteobacteria bacterium]|nr:hypothetical protein [Pseudomonadota bacterium]
MKKFFYVVALLLAPLIANAQATGFQADEELDTNARKWAEEFVVFAGKQYSVNLDWSHTSIKYLDDILDDLHATFVRENPPEEQLIPVARAVGSYVAEVSRILNGGSWGWVEMPDGSFPGVETPNGTRFLPFAKVLDRIKSGEDPDIWEYYQMLSVR